MRAVRLILAMTGAAALVGVGLPAQAATVDQQSCTVSVSLPDKLVIKSWNTIVTAELDDPTDCVDYASWDIAKGAEGTEGTSSSASFSSPNTVDRVSFYTGPSGNHSGTYRALGSHASSDDTYVNADGYDETVVVVQTDSGPMSVKYASKFAWVIAERNGKRTTLKAKATRYTPFGGFGGYVAWKRAEVQVQKRVGDTWRTVKTLRTDSKGMATARVSGAKRSWRLVTADSASVWGTATSSKRR